MSVVAHPLLGELYDSNLEASTQNLYRVNAHECHSRMTRNILLSEVGIILELFSKFVHAGLSRHEAVVHTLPTLEHVSQSEDEDTFGLRASVFPYWFGPTRVVCPAVPLHEEFFHHSDRCPNHCSRITTYVNSGIARLVRRSQVDANDKIPSET